MSQKFYLGLEDRNGNPTELAAFAESKGAQAYVAATVMFAQYHDKLPVALLTLAIRQTIANYKLAEPVLTRVNQDFFYSNFMLSHISWERSNYHFLHDFFAKLLHYLIKDDKVKLNALLSYARLDVEVVNEVYCNLQHLKFKYMNPKNLPEEEFDYSLTGMDFSVKDKLLTRMNLAGNITNVAKLTRSSDFCYGSLDNVLNNKHYQLDKRWYKTMPENRDYCVYQFVKKQHDFACISHINMDDIIAVSKACFPDALVETGIRQVCPKRIELTPKQSFYNSEFARTLPPTDITPNPAETEEMKKLAAAEKHNKNVIYGLVREYVSNEDIHIELTKNLLTIKVGNASVINNATLCKVDIQAVKTSIATALQQHKLELSEKIAEVLEYAKYGSLNKYSNVTHSVLVTGDKRELEITTKLFESMRDEIYDDVKNYTIEKLKVLNQRFIALDLPEINFDTNHAILPLQQAEKLDYVQDDIEQRLAELNEFLTPLEELATA